MCLVHHKSTNELAAPGRNEPALLRVEFGSCQGSFHPKTRVQKPTALFARDPTMQARKRVPLSPCFGISGSSGSSRPTSQLTDAGPMVSGCQPRRDPGVRCSRLVSPNVYLNPTHRPPEVVSAARENAGANPPPAGRSWLDSCDCVDMETIATVAQIQILMELAWSRNRRPNIVLTIMNNPPKKNKAKCHR
jgi:hypothetical protein